MGGFVLNLPEGGLTAFIKVSTGPQSPARKVTARSGPQQAPH